MVGVLIGAVVAASLAAQGGGGTPPDAPSPAPSCRKGTFRVEFNGNPENWAELKGCADSSGVVTWWPDEQRYSIRPYEGVVYKGTPADRWIGCDVNDRPVSMWGWKSADGRLHWRIADQKTAVLGRDGAGAAAPPTGALAPSGDPAIIASLPKGGVVASKLQGPAVIASDPAEKAKVQTLMETKGGGGSSTSGSTPPSADCEPKPEKIPIPPLSRGVGLDWRLAAKVAAAASAVFAGFVFLVAAVIVVARNRKQVSP